MRAAPRWARRAVGTLLLLVLWRVFSATGVLDPDVLASPGTIARAGADLMIGASNEQSGFEAPC
ncbi:hypothetical protein GCM10010253_51680 [Streptomyces badius]|uniref:Uncharacterized protein n=1 Tax=Streptomyces badius TaxID=1941 RepID=A0ABQ2THF4_STRBA|nr:hypothetical protein GCM10010253_51680 [Streptomyces badius]